MLLKMWLGIFHAIWFIGIIECEAFLCNNADSCPDDQKEPWSYRGDNGPPNWGKRYPKCYGQNQSPIDIEAGKAVQDTNLGKITFSNYEKPLTQQAVIRNNGHSARVEPGDETERTIQIGQPPVTYTLRQFHFHWGGFWGCGSEHLFDGQGYANELHLVHTSSENRVAVLGILFQEDVNNNTDLDPLVKSLPLIKYKNSNATLVADLDLRKLLPANIDSYFRYSGSLTTPQCDEGVTWTVFKDLVKIGTRQMKEFRKLKSVTKSSQNAGKCQLVNNYRPVQPLNNRQVSSST